MTGAIIATLHRLIKSILGYGSWSLVGKTFIYFLAFATINFIVYRIKEGRD